MVDMNNSTAGRADNDVYYDVILRDMIAVTRSATGVFYIFNNLSL